MAPLTSDLRRTLENNVLKARDEAERAATAALAALAIERGEPFAAMTDEQRRLRNALRARARQLGGGNQADGMALLVEEVAYVQWHRMLFARFLAENDLLMHPAGVPTTLEECAELAAEEGEPDAWQLAARYAGLMLPGIFRPTDPTAQLRFAPRAAPRWSGLSSICRSRSSLPMTPSAGSTSSGRPGVRKRSTRAAARSAAPTSRR